MLLWVLPGPDRPLNAVREPIEIWSRRGGLSESSMSMSSQGYSPSMESTNPSMNSGASGSMHGGSVHGPYHGGLLGIAHGGNANGDKNNFNFSKAPGVDGIAVSTAGLDLSASVTMTTSPQQLPSTTLPFHQPLLPPQVSIICSLSARSNKQKSFVVFFSSLIDLYVYYICKWVQGVFLRAVSSSQSS